MKQSLAQQQLEFFLGQLTPVMDKLAALQDALQDATDSAEDALPSEEETRAIKRTKGGSEANAAADELETLIKALNVVSQAPGRLAARVAAAQAATAK